MIERCFDAGVISEILEADASALVNDRRNIILISGQDIGAFAWRGPGIYEGHIHFKSRGAAAFRVAQAMLDGMGEHARMVWGLTPENLRHVRLFNRKCGFVSQGILDTPEGRCELFVREYLCR